MITFGTKIRTIRAVHNLTQAEVAQRAKLSRNDIMMFENNRALPTDEAKTKIETALGIDLDAPQVEAAFKILAGVSQSSLNRGNSNTDEYRIYDAYQASLKAAAEKHGACPRCEAPLMPTQNNNERWCGNCKVAFPLAEVQPLKEAA